MELKKIKEHYQYLISQGWQLQPMMKFIEKIESNKSADYLAFGVSHDILLLSEKKDDNKFSKTVQISCKESTGEIFFKGVNKKDSNNNSNEEFKVILDENTSERDIEQYIFKYLLQKASKKGD
jgi:hypothetical protein